MSRRLAAVLCALVVLVAACGSDDPDDTSSDTTEASDGTDVSEPDEGGSDDAVAAEEWTNDVCGAFFELSEKLESVTAEDPELAAILEGNFEPADVDELRAGFALIEGLFTELGGAIEEAAEGVQDAGVPDVTGGEEFRDGLVSAMQEAATLIADARDELASADVDSLESLQQLETTFTDFGAAFDALPELDLGETGPPEIQAAFTEAPRCQEGEERFGSDG